MWPRAKVKGVEVDGAKPCPLGAFDVELHGVPDVHSASGFDAKGLQCELKNPGVGLLHADDTRVDDHPDPRHPVSGNRTDP